MIRIARHRRSQLREHTTYATAPNYLQLVRACRPAEIAGPGVNALAPPPRPGERFLVTWARRSVTIPLYLLAALILVSATPLLLPLLAFLDLARRSRLALVRSLLMVDVYLLAETAGILVGGAIWVSAGGWRRRPSAAYLDRNFRLQCRWASALLWSARRIFALDLEVEGDQDVRHGPIIVIGRHVSPVDNLVPAVFVSARHGLRLRWVINRWLLRDPCLDIVGGRLPNVFVDAARDEPGGQAARVGVLAEGLGSGDGVLIYPEGALFSAARRARVIARLAATDPAASQRAEALEHLLPPRTGGFVAALAAAPGADVVVCSHTGLEAAGSYRAFLSGGLVGAPIRIQFRRVARAAIPPDARGQAMWLWQTWSEVDRWIASAGDAGHIRTTLEPGGGQ